MMHRGTLVRSAVMLLLALSAAGCSDPLAPDRDFLIRTPERRTTAQTPVAHTVSPTSTGDLLVEWSPAAGAQTYTVVFWRGADEAEVERLEADFSSPLMIWDHTSPQIEDVPLYPDTEDERTTRLVRFEVPLSDIAARLQAAGVTPGTSVYSLLSVFAKNGGDEWRSSSLTPVHFTLEAGS